MGKIYSKDVQSSNNKSGSRRGGWACPDSPLPMLKKRRVDQLKNNKKIMRKEA
jgi:hypothetical protein